MTSTSPTTTTTSPDPYTFSRPAAAATRNLISPDPSSHHSSGTATPSDPTSPHGTLHRRKTNNYETALADRLLKEADTTEVSSDGTDINNSKNNNNNNDKPTIVSGLAYRGDRAAKAVGAASSLATATGRGVVDNDDDNGPTGPVTEGEGRPLLGVLGRQQSFKQGDQKRMNMERMLSTRDAGKGPGYTTSQPATPVSG